MISNQQHIEEINNYVRYDGKPKPGEFDITELGSELLVNYLARTSEPNGVSLTIGDLNYLIRNVFTFYSSEYFLDNEWTININTHHSYETNSIYLSTILSTNRILELQKAVANNEYHPLIIELSLINAILVSQGYDNPKLFIVAVDRLHTDYKPMPTKAWNLIELTNPMNKADIDKLLIERTNALQRHLSDGTEPSKCVDIKWHKKNGKSINMTCKRCNYSNSCKHYSNYISDKQIANSLIF